jgi:hypothetical protein
MIRKAADDLSPPSQADLRRLRQAMEGPIDLSDIPESPPGRRKKRTLNSKDRPSIIRHAILVEMRRRGMTRYQLWKAAQPHCGTLSESAVYEFLRGQRQIGLAYVEAMMVAMSLQITALPPTITLHMAKPVAPAGRGGHHRR